MDDQRGSRDGGRGPTRHAWRAPRRQLLVLLGMTGFAISQPLLSILGQSPTTLTFHGVDGPQVALFAVVVALVPPVVLWALTLLVRRVDQTAGAFAHLAVIAVLAACTIIPLVKAIAPAVPLLVLVGGVAAGTGFAVLYARSPAIAVWARYTAILPALAMISFVLLSPAGDLRRSAAAPDRVSSAAPSVVFLVLDELPTRSILDADGGIDAARFPNLAAFADDATWYRHHTSLASRTEVAMPSLLAGTIPTTAKPLWTEHPDNLFTMLAPTHELETIEVATDLCPYDGCGPTTGSGETISSGPGFRDLLGVTQELWAERASPREAEASRLDDFDEVQVSVPDPVRSGPATTEPEEREPREGGVNPTDDAMVASSASVQAMIRAFDASKGSALYFLHLLLPHQPWRFYPDGTLYTDTDDGGGSLEPQIAKNRFSWNSWDATVFEERHLLQVEYTDRLLGQLFEGLRDGGLYDDSLIVITSDHGFNFELDTEARLVTPETVDALAYVPLLIKEPGQQEGRIDDSNVWSIDVLPSLAELLEVELPGAVDGHAIGSPGVAARGTDKVQYDMRGLGEVTAHGVIEFDDAETFPLLVAQRWIEPGTPPGDPSAALAPHLRVGDAIGRSFADLDAIPGGSIDLLGEDELVRPAERAPIGVAAGIIDDSPAGAEAVLAVDGVIVAGSPLNEDPSGRFRVTFLLSQGSLDEENRIEVALLLPDGSARELEIT